MILTIKNNKSTYYSYLKQFGQRNLEEDFRNGVPLQQTIQNSGRYFARSESEIIDIDYNLKLLTIHEKFSLNCYVYSDVLQTPDWKIQMDTATIMGQHCQKATTFFKGRNFIAWFAPSIPFNSGPWLFNSLPGLILRASDEKEQFVFECMELNTGIYTTKVFKPYVSCSLISKSKLQAKKKMSIANPLAFMQAESGKIGTSVGGDGSPERRPDGPYNPIDLSQQ